MTVHVYFGKTEDKRFELRFHEDNSITFLFHENFARTYTIERVIVDDKPIWFNITESYRGNDKQRHQIYNWIMLHIEEVYQEYLYDLAVEEVLGE
jgi:hypothetical protein